MTLIKSFKSLLLLASVLLLTACGTSTAEEMHEHLEKAVEMEEVFEEQQQPLVKAEEREHEIYQEILSLGLAEMDEIEELAREAQELVEEREERIEQEYESLTASYNEFENAAEMVEDIEEDAVRSQAEEMVDHMESRFSAYESMHEGYETAIDLDRELYHMFLDDDLTIEELSEHIEEVNETYQQIIDDKESFNAYTDQYNEAKHAFYEEAGLDVEETEAPDSSEAENTSVDGEMSEENEEDSADITEEDEEADDASEDEDNE
ncbi:putative cell-wall binding lipoprotein [Salsuginibacillus halophilus]|uniref:Putative cell-wall binding lipoprotein n=1 Tax=Salsuginibacillus halophilus TaxID=517424 RepID=A0A2P8HX77_9BACI|nr:YkyA family protein [Salsuginibacillus halophilus]PSL50853.1 putative cell-wall binding lipoprotein [Salsuginibacillus halophilus]